MPLGEFELIEQYFRALGSSRADVVRGIGDDAAILASSADVQLVAAIDTLVDGVHFPRGSPAASIGHRALAVNLSDLAAMGAQPAWALREHRPKMILAGFSAYSRVIEWARFADIAKEVGAFFVVDMAHVAGLVAAGLYPNPVPHADAVTTTTHKTLRGPRGGMILARRNDELTKKFNSLVFPGTQGGPLMHVIAAKAVALLEALQPEFAEYQQQVVANARAMSARLTERGYRIVSGGTDNHLFLMDLADRPITGKEADAALGNANITVNKNAVPNDPRPPAITSGLRIGTPAATTRGFGEREIREVSDMIADVLDANGAAAAIERVRPRALELCRRFPVYGP